MMKVVLVMLLLSPTSVIAHLAEPGHVHDGVISAPVPILVLWTVALVFFAAKRLGGMIRSGS